MMWAISFVFGALPFGGHKRWQPGVLLSGGGERGPGNGGMQGAKRAQRGN